ncbi:MAG: ATP-binding protein [Eubacteriaceae bacterium]|nr:ATP-binding protein [Eubacteriaceae bacterium]
MIKRERYIQRIRPFIGTELIKVLTGIRRSGKSVMLELIKEELREQGISDTQFITFNFESLANAKYCTSDALYKELDKRVSDISEKSYLFFDEIQEVDGWEKCINSARMDFDCDIYITGSNAKLLSGELATYLGGRYVEFLIYPFSFEEYLECRKQDQTLLSIPDEFKNYIDLGGMPFLTNLYGDRTASLQYLRDLYNSVILKDVVKRNNIRDVDLLERIITYVLANVGHTFSARGISNYFKSENRRVAPETILNYIKACCDAYLFFKLSREDIAGKKILSVNEKYYIVDHGIREAVYGGTTRNMDQLLENIVCMELIRRGYTVTIGKVMDKEVDFVAQSGNEKIYVQVAYLLSSQDTVEREFRAYDAIRDNYPKYVISMDDYDMSRDGIKHRNIRDFLLAEKWD